MKKLTYLLSLLAIAVFMGCQSNSNQANESTDATSDPGVKIGAITYSWRSMPSTPEDIIKYCKETQIQTLELMGNIVESYAGIPDGPPRRRRDQQMTAAEEAEFNAKVDAAKAAQKEWRTTVSMEKFQALRKMFDEAGIEIHIVKFSPANWSDEEIDYAFKVAKILGAQGVSNEIGHEAAKRLGPFAEKHNMYAIFHNHTQPGEPGFDFADYLAYSPNNRLNFDVGHYVGATGKHPNEIIQKFHDKIVSLHMKDKTNNVANPPNSNKVWGEGDTPIADILNLIREKKWPIYCDIELEYEVPEGSNAVIETKKCYDYCMKMLGIE